MPKIERNGQNSAARDIRVTARGLHRSQPVVLPSRAGQFAQAILARYGCHPGRWPHLPRLFRQPWPVVTVRPVHYQTQVHLAPRLKLNEALSWFDAHPSIGDVLITGGDPMVMKDEQLEYLLKNLAQKPQVYRIRIGTRTPVVLPMRFTSQFMEMIGKYHQPPRLEIAFVTHFEHAYEITPEALETNPEPPNFSSRLIISPSRSAG